MLGGCLGLLGVPWEGGGCLGLLGVPVGGEGTPAAGPGCSSVLAAVLPDPWRGSWCLHGGGGSPPPPHTCTALAPWGHPTGPGWAPAKAGPPQLLPGLRQPAFASWHHCRCCSSSSSSASPTCEAWSPLHPTERHPRDRPSFPCSVSGTVALDGREIGLLAAVGLRWPVSAMACRAVPYCANTQDRPAGGEPGMLGPCHGWWGGRAWPPRGPSTVLGRLRFAVWKFPSPLHGSSPVPAWPCCAPDVVLFRHGDGRGGVPHSPPAQPHGCLQQQLRCPHVPTYPHFQVPVCQHPQVPKS